MLREYNYLFKRKEIVQLKHKWETDDEDVAADVIDSSQTEDEDGTVGEKSKALNPRSLPR